MTSPQNSVLLWYPQFKKWPPDQFASGRNLGIILAFDSSLICPLHTYPVHHQFWFLPLKYVSDLFTLLHLSLTAVSTSQSPQGCYGDLSFLQHRPYNSPPPLQPFSGFPSCFGQISKLLICLGSSLVCLACLSSLIFLTFPSIHQHMDQCGPLKSLLAFCLACSLGVQYHLRLCHVFTPVSLWLTFFPSEYLKYLWNKHLFFLWLQALRIQKIGMGSQCQQKEQMQLLN